MQCKCAPKSLVLILIVIIGNLTPVFAQGHPTGLIFSDPAVYNALPLAAPALTGVFPRSVDLSISFPPVGDQGKQGSCVGWAVSYLKSYQEMIKRHWDRADNKHKFSAAYIYNRIKQNGPCTMGTRFEDALSLMKTDGIATLNDFPYVDGDCARVPDPVIITSARQYRIFRWYRVDVLDLDDIKSHLLAGYPVLIGMMIDNDFQRLTGDTVYHRAPTAISAGGHAMVVVGYDDARGAIRVINSWGESWGDQGMGWIAYESFRIAVKQAYIVQDNFGPGPVVPPSDGNADGQPPSVVTFDGRREFLGDATVQTKRIIFKQGAVIRVRNGSILELLANEIIVEGSAVIDGTGEPGANGLDGGPHPGGEWVSQGDSDYWKPDMTLKGI